MLSSLIVLIWGILWASICLGVVLLGVLIIIVPYTLHHLKENWRSQEQPKEEPLNRPLDPAKEVDKKKLYVDAVHEAGHIVGGAVLGLTLRKSSIMPRVNGTGWPFTQHDIPLTDREQRAFIILIYCGHEAERELLWICGAGAAQDREKAFNDALELLTSTWHPSDNRLVGTLPLHLMYRDGLLTPKERRRMTEQAKKLLLQCHEEARRLTKKHRQFIEAVAHVLMQQHELTLDDLDRIRAQVTE
jgi:ATP-dependent Zn protease